MGMNKVLLVFIVASGFLLFIYANSSVFNRHLVQKNSPERLAASAAAALVHHSHQHHHKPHEGKHRNGTGSENGTSDVLANKLKRVKYISKGTNDTEYNIFLIYTKESQNLILHSQLELFLRSLLKYSTIELHLHIITDEQSERSAEELIKQQIERFHRTAFYTLYDVRDCAEKISDIVHGMMPLFNYRSGSYYSDALFLLSLGLHRIVDRNMRRAILIDCDVVFRASVKELFDQFELFAPDQLFGLAPELTPVYRHVLSRYRMNNPHTIFGSPYYMDKLSEKTDESPPSANEVSHSKNAVAVNENRRHGYPGLNSGVVMLHLDRIRRSRLYEEIIKESTVKNMAEKYSFQGHLGDQDFYTLMGFEFPGLIYRLDCVWNRQLCTWWREHGYSDIFDQYFHCEGTVKIYHGNCNTRAPE
ncbi:xyloside xylosyltransferase 1 [Anopheles maculipalpis]|uniref:xyloside xylosyltransferase 1 n=1 Tax=Anopheles maculipalpis TaxID=1496333 RepID=UPI002158F5AD|nr:xyloside xylosyltransferase 1 [Anopheles maculipalpis]